jgi:hypothetical protein
VAFGIASPEVMADRGHGVLDEAAGYFWTKL